MNINYFFVIYAVTILAARIPLLFWHQHAPTIAGFQLHHYMYGVLLVALYFLFSKITILAIGLGLIVDELPLFFIFKGWNWPDDHWQQYHSVQSVASIIMISVIGYLVMYLINKYV